jgi:hypothetical protein
MNIKYLFTLLLLIIGFSTNISAHGDIKFHLQLAMQVGDAHGIAATMEDEPEITLEYMDVKQKQTKQGLEKKMQEFFSANKPDSFSIMHNGQFQNGVRHMTGIFINTKGERFEVYFEAVYDEVEAHHHLSYMRIEKIAE